jgi:large subunit ribosomal protein L15
VKLHDLAPAEGAHRRKRRLARGIGGKGGKTAGRGTKGQKARDTVKPGFEGGQLPLTQRVPKLRGFKNPFKVSYAVVNLDRLSALSDAGEVDPEVLLRAGILREGELVKVLGRGTLAAPLRLRVHAISASARSAVEAAGGSVEMLALPFRQGRPAARGNALTNR